MKFIPLRHFVPLALKRLILSFNFRAYSNFEGASTASTGYESPLLLNSLFSDHIDHKLNSDDSYPLEALRSLISLAGCASSGTITVLDFGGGLGRAYNLSRKFLPSDIVVKWIVVETEPLVARAIKEGIATPELIFVTSIANALCHAKRFDVVYSDAALQYTRDPMAILTELLNLDFSRFMLTRFPVNTDSDQEYFGVQYSSLSSNGQKARYAKWSMFTKRISYPFTILPKSKIEQVMQHRHQILLKTQEDLYAYPMSVGWFNNYGYIIK